MLSRLGSALVVAVAVTIGCYLASELLALLNISLATVVGAFLNKYAVAFGVLAGFARFLSGDNRWFGGKL